jgi:hypothetical protein
LFSFINKNDSVERHKIASVRTANQLSVLRSICTMSAQQSKDSFPSNDTTNGTTQQQPNAAQILQQVLNNNSLLPQQQPQPSSLWMNPNAVGAFFANSLAAFQQQQQQQQQNQQLDPSSVLFQQMALLSSVAPGAAATLYQNMNEETTLPTYVNPKQYARILKRRDARRIMEEYFARKRREQQSKRNKPYMHESRHNHAMKRPRGPGGRFLTKEELEGLRNEEDGPSDNTANPDEDSSISKEGSS